MAHGLPSLLLILPLLSACSWESLQRTGYETVESMRIQQCLDRQDDPDCATERQRYDQYERQKPGDTRE
jgi:hypothetical protein